MDFQFILPLTNSDLLNSSRDTYYVKHLYSPGEIPEKLKGIYLHILKRFLKCINIIKYF